MNKIILTLAIVIASFFRLYQLSSLPIELFGDEIDVGYQSWSISQTGRDYMGNFLPTYIRSFSEWRAPLVMYLTAPFVAILGPNAFAVRLPIALTGILSIYLLYLVLNKLGYSSKVSAFASLILAITPWHIHYSRASFEVVPLTFLILLGLYLYLSKMFYVSLIPFVLTFYTYSTAVVFTPLLLLGLLIIFPPNFKKINYVSILSVLLSTFLLIPVFRNILFGNAANRFQSLSILSSSKLIDSVVLSRNEPWISSPLVERLLVNKFVIIGKVFVENYLSSFSPSFLFAKGDPYFRHSSGMSGELLPVFFFLFMLGLYSISQKPNDKKNQVLIWMLVISPIAASLTMGGGDHGTRLFLMVLPLTSICGLSFDLFTNNFWSKSISLVTLVLTLFTFSLYWYNYTAHYRYQSANFWNYGYQSIFADLSKVTAKYDNVYINNTYQPSLLPFLFYTKYLPSNFHQDFITDNQNSYQQNGFVGFRFADKYYFGQVDTLENLHKLLEGNTIYLAVQGKEVPGDWDWSKEPPSWLRVVSVTYDSFHKPLFYLVEKSK